MFTGDFTLVHTYVCVYLQDTYECVYQIHMSASTYQAHMNVLCMTGAVFKGLGSLLRMRGAQSAQETRGAQSLHDDTKVSNSWMPQLQRPTTKSAAAAEPAAVAAAMSEAVAPRAASGTPNKSKEMYISIKRRINKTCSLLLVHQHCGNMRALPSSGLSVKRDGYIRKETYERKVLSLIHTSY